MPIQRVLTTGALCAALGLFGSAVYAQTASTMEDAAIMADEAAEVEALAAEAEAEAAVARDKKKAAEAAKLHSEEVSGDMNPVDEGDAAQMEKDK
jgi:hypothetical protein